MFPIVEATKAGIAVGRYGDAINIAYPESNTRRGRVGKEIAQSLLTGCSPTLLASDYKQVPLVLERVDECMNTERERESNGRKGYRK